jgi:hydrogenase-4 component E
MYTLSNIIFFAEFFAFVAVLFMNVMKRKSMLIWLYVMQSLGILTLLTIQAVEIKAWAFIAVFIVFVLLKIILIPVVFLRFIRNSNINLSVSPYMKVPQTIMVLLGLLYFAQSSVFFPISRLLLPLTIPYLPLMVIGSIFASLLILINKKGAITMVVGLLALENSIVGMGYFLGLEQAVVIEIALLLDLFIWILVVLKFIREIYAHFTSVDISRLNQLQK